MFENAQFSNHISKLNNEYCLENHLGLTQIYVKLSADLWPKPKNKGRTGSCNILGFRLVIASTSTVCACMFLFKSEAWKGLSSSWNLKSRRMAQCVNTGKL